MTALYNFLDPQGKSFPTIPLLMKSDSFYYIFLRRRDGRNCPVSSGWIFINSSYAYPHGKSLLTIPLLTKYRGVGCMSMS